MFHVDEILGLSELPRSFDSPRPGSKEVTAPSGLSLPSFDLIRAVRSKSLPRIHALALASMIEFE
jgi:hypothetical protein